MKYLSFFAVVQYVKKNISKIYTNTCNWNYNIMAILNSATLATLFFSGLAIFSRVTFLIVTPLFLDYFRVHDIPWFNVSKGTGSNESAMIDVLPAQPTDRNMNAVFVTILT